MAVGDAYVFPGFLTPVPTQFSFPKPPTTFLICFSRGKRRKYSRKKSRLNRESNSQPPGHESNTLTTEPPGRGAQSMKNMCESRNRASYNRHWGCLLISKLICNTEISLAVHQCSKFHAVNRASDLRCARPIDTTFST